LSPSGPRLFFARELRRQSFFPASRFSFDKEGVNIYNSLWRSPAHPRFSETVFDARDAFSARGGRSVNQIKETKRHTKILNSEGKTRGETPTCFFTFFKRLKNA
jgi:hypothetical protein